MLKHIAAVAFLAIAACTSSPQAGGHGEMGAGDAAAAGWKQQALADAITWVGAQKSTGFVIVQDNKIIVEKYWPVPDDAASKTFLANFTHGTAADGALLEDVASQQKSFVAILAGVAMDKGLLDLSKPVSFYAKPGWSKATPEQESAITVRNLMEMNSGLKENLTYEAAPDTKFFYNTPAYAIMKKVLEGASKMSLDDLTQAWLSHPAGMHDTAWRQRPGAFADSGNPTGLVTTPRDIAKMGLLVLDHGVAADGKRVISQAQLEALFVRTKTNPAYGHLWWLNGSDYVVRAGAQRSETQLIPSGPRDLIAALGAQDRKLYVVPSLKLVVVRTGQAAPDRAFDEELWKRLMAAR